MRREFKIRTKGPDLRVAIVAARFNETITNRLLEGALVGLEACGLDKNNIAVAWVPGSLELGIIARAFANSGKYDAIVCLGAVIRGETGHYDVVATQSTASLSRIALDTGIPIGMGILTTDDVAQAMERSGGKVGNKGYDSAVTAVEVANLLTQITGL
ncbi:6,7-dimethyl-8-ribityllumazine synthase [SAR202 cluster bacterium AD-804-J14_MRT_500m]|nr:6,7-dimethyl-8-ribityllumazine synthase [SAR202 cluster bacterium AD-804-J14_MRT_500m]